MKDCLQAEMDACSHKRMLASFFVDEIINTLYNEKDIIGIDSTDAGSLLLQGGRQSGGGYLLSYQQCGWQGWRHCNTLLLIGN